MWGIKLKGFIRQADLSYSQSYDDDGEDDKDNNFQDDNDKGGMNDKDNLLYNKYIMWGIQLKGFIRQGYLSYSKGFIGDGEESEDDNIKNDNKDNMIDNDNLL